MHIDILVACLFNTLLVCVCMCVLCVSVCGTVIQWSLNLLFAELCIYTLLVCVTCVVCCLLCCVSIVQCGRARPQWRKEELVKRNSR